MELSDKIHEFLISSLGVTRAEAEDFDRDTLTLAKEIALYAHEGQKRENGEPYVNHPLRCLALYEELIGLKEKSDFAAEELSKYGIPYYGVRELCVLHDVAEDTSVTVKGIKELYAAAGFKDYFEKYIEKPLGYITHKNGVSYDDYIEIVMKDPVSAMVKTMDLSDNSNLLGLLTIDDRKLARAEKYLRCLKRINDKYNFLKNVALYKAENRRK